MQTPTQPATTPEPVVPNNSAILARVLDRHNISQLQLATYIGCAESSISRMVGGSMNITPEVTRALWQRTHDHELVALALGEDDAMVLSMGDDTDRSQHWYNHRVMASASEIMVSLTNPRARTTKTQMIAKAEQAMRDLHLFRNKLVAGAAAHPTATLDEVA